MVGESQSSEELLEVSSGRILGGPDDSIFDDIFDWIANAVTNIVNSVNSWVSSAWGAITSTVTSWVSWAVDTIKGWWQNVLTWVQNAQQWVVSTYNVVSSWISSAWNTVYSAVTSAITTVNTWINSIATTVTSWISSRVGELWTWISGALSSLGSSLSGWFSQVWGDISSRLSGFYSSLQTFISNASGSINATIRTITDQVGTTFDWFTTWLNEHIVKPLGTWWSQFMDRIMDFPSWVGKLFDTIAAWLTVEVPGHSPRWTAIFENIGHWFAKWFYEFPKWFFGNLPERVAYGLAASWDWFTKGLQPVVDTFMSALVQYTAKLGPFAPSMAAQNYTSLISVGATAVFGLVGMTIAGELLHPLKNIGLGNVAAMIFDLTNYKMLTGAFVTALATAAIAIPMRWYYYDLFRPNLPSIREGSDFYASDDIDLAGYSRLLAYHGIPNEWHHAYADSAYRAPSPYQLSIAAAAGTIDLKVLETELRRAGYHPDVRAMYLDSFAKMAAGNVKAVMVASATGRFKKGITDEAGLTAELKILNVGDSVIPLYVAGAKLDYATDYINDLSTAFQDAVRSGQIGLDDYRQALLNLGLLPERVEGRVLIEKLRIKPKAAPTPVSTPTPAYLTDQGKITVDTIRRQRRKKQLTRDQEIVRLLSLGMDNDYAAAIADNDDARLGESAA